MVFPKPLSKKNWDLIKEFSLLVESLPKVPWIVGISRKSFLKEMTYKKYQEEILTQTEYLQMGLISSWINKLKSKPVFFRMHAPGIFAMAKVLEDMNVS